MLLDSPLWIDVAPFAPGVVPLAAQCQAALPLFNASASLSAACVAKARAPSVAAAARQRRGAPGSSCAPFRHRWAAPTRGSA